MDTESTAAPVPHPPWQRLISLAGNESKLAAALGVKPQAVQQWSKNGVPPRRVIPAAAVVDFQVTPHELDQQLYPHPEDGLPEDRRRSAASSVLDQLRDVLKVDEYNELLAMIERGPEAALGFIRGLCQQHQIPWTESLIVGGIPPPPKLVDDGSHDTSRQGDAPQQ